MGLLGLDLGPERWMLGADELNPRGYWEQRAVVELNDEILAALGRPWWDPIPAVRGWEHAPELRHFHTRVRELVARHFPGGRRWAVKDPRLVFTLPLWRAAIGDLDCLVCVRNPLEVVASGDRSGQVGQDLLEVWAHFNRVALRTTEGLRRGLVFHADWFQAPEATAAAVAAFVDRGTGIDSSAVERVVATVDPHLHRNRADDLELATSGQVPAETRIQYFLMRELALAETRGDTDAARALSALICGLGRSG